MVNGAKYERDLRDLLYESGFAGLREPGSGSDPKREAPDILARIGGIDFAIELKYTGGEYARFSIGDLDDPNDDDDINGIINFAEWWGAVPVMCARFSHDVTFYIDDPYRWTDHKHGSTTIKRKDKEEYATIEDLFVLGDDTGVEGGSLQTTLERYSIEHEKLFS